MLTTFVALSPDTRTFGAMSLLGAFLLTVALVRALGLSWRRSIAIVMFGAAPMAITVGALHDLLPLVPPVSVSRVLIVVLWVFSSRTLGVSLASRISGPEQVEAFIVRTSAVTLASAWYVGGLARQFLPGADIVTRLSFAILEEDNAHVIGVMREVATLGPRGGVLAEMYGTGYVVLPDLLIRLLGGPMSSELGDPRQAAVTTFATSSLLIILLLGLTLWILTEALGARNGPPSGVRRSSHGSTFATTLFATWIALAVIIVIPMRTSFLTFVWGVALLAAATAFAAMAPLDARLRDVVSLLLHIAAAAWLLLGSWPFVIAGLVPVVGGSLIAMRRRVTLPSTRSVGIGIGIGITASMIIAAAVFAPRWADSGPLAEVLSYGRTLLTIEASEIRADPYAWALLAVLLIIAVAGSLLEGSTTRRSALALSPIASLALTYLALLAAAFLLTDGELNYAGDKLRYAIIALGLLLSAPLAVRTSERWPSLPKVSLVAALVSAIVLSPTVRPHETWWDRSRPQRLPQSEIVAETLLGSRPDVPIRCLPPPDLEADRVARRAAYECVRFVEDAFNDDRRHGHRFTFLETQDQTFRRAVDLALADLELSKEITRLTMRGGWAGLPLEKVSGLPSPWPAEREQRSQDPSGTAVP